MSFATYVSGMGKSIRSAFTRIDAEQEARNERRVVELRAITQEAAKLKRLKEQEGWAIYTKKAESRLNSLTQQLQTVSADKLSLLQAQIAELNFVLAIIPKALESACEAHDELETLSKEEE